MEDGQDRQKRNTEFRRNTRQEFVGIEVIKAKQKEYLDRFERRAAQGQWREIHEDHYDWWMFPIDRDSRGQGAKWTVYAGDVAELKKDPEYLRNYLRGVEILMASWGWDFWEGAFLPNPVRDQCWQNWPIRLHKAATSLRLFGFEEEFQSLRKFARILMQRGENFNDGYDLSLLFTTGLKPEGDR